MSKSRASDQESRRLIRQELLTNILVEAGAGSGKTQMLAERMAAGIAVGVYQVEHLAAVTFTRKAASELRGRFHLALEKQLLECRTGSSDPADPAASARGCCASVPSNPVCRPASSNWTKCRIWSCATASGAISSRTLAPPAIPT